MSSTHPWMPHVCRMKMFAHIIATFLWIITGSQLMHQADGRSKIHFCTYKLYYFSALGIIENYFSLLNWHSNDYIFENNDKHIFNPCIYHPIITIMGVFRLPAAYNT